MKIQMKTVEEFGLISFILKDFLRSNFRFGTLKFAITKFYSHFLLTSKIITYQSKFGAITWENGVNESE